MDGNIDFNAFVSVQISDLAEMPSFHALFGLARRTQQVVRLTLGVATR